MEKLSFSVLIDAPRAGVWNTMLGAETYRDWTRPFCEDSYFVGSWDAGEHIHFLAPDGSGMCSVIAENRLREYVSIKHLGYVSGGIDDISSEQVRSWARCAPLPPAYFIRKLSFASGLPRSVRWIDSAAGLSTRAQPSESQCSGNGEPHEASVGECLRQKWRCTNFFASCGPPIAAGRVLFIHQTRWPAKPRIEISGVFPPPDGTKAEIKGRHDEHV